MSAGAKKENEIVKIKPRVLVDFFDGKTKKTAKINGPHVKAFNAFIGEELLISLLCSYLKEIGQHCILIKEDGRRVTPKAVKSRKKLDAWLKIDLEGKGYKYLKTEVKNWTSYSPGGVSLSQNNNSEEVSEKRFNEFIEGNKIKDIKCLSKVLEDMEPPPGRNKETILPCILFWFCIGEKNSEPFFRTFLPDEKKTELWVFSASRFLRDHIDDYELELLDPEGLGLNERWDILTKMIY